MFTPPRAKLIRGFTQEGLKLQSYPKIEVAGRREREENVIDEWEFETLQEKRGVQYLVHYERKKWDRTVPAGNRETESSEGGVWRGTDASTARGRTANFTSC